MAGNYPDYPDHRMALDKDGTQIVTVTSGGGITPWSSGDITYLCGDLNNESTSRNWASGNPSAPASLAVLFPEARTITNYFVMSGDGGWVLKTIQTSNDTTNGYDGTWTTVKTWTAYEEQSYRADTYVPRYRTEIYTLGGASNIRAIRFRGQANGMNIVKLHLFGTYYAGANPDRCELWHPTLDQRIGPAYFDWGNVPRNSTADKPFRVKNLSSTLTANSILVSTDATWDASPSMVAQHFLNLNGGSFAANQTISALAPGAISNTLVLRRTTPSGAALSLWAARLKAVPASWT